MVKFRTSKLESEITTERFDHDSSPQTTPSPPLNIREWNTGSGMIRFSIFLRKWWFHIRKRYDPPKHVSEAHRRLDSLVSRNLMEVLDGSGSKGFLDGKKGVCGKFKSVVQIFKKNWLTIVYDSKTTPFFSFLSGRVALNWPWPHVSLYTTSLSPCVGDKIIHLYNTKRGPSWRKKVLAP